MPKQSSFAEAISKLKFELSKELPGIEAQKIMSPSIREDLKGNNQPNSRTQQSAILILLFPDKYRVSTLLIKRPIYQGPHSGQISFPGGKFEHNDRSILHTALREAYEEVGVSPADVTVIGRLTTLYIPISNMLVTPIVGSISSKPTLIPNPREVEYAIIAPLKKLLHPRSKNSTVIALHGKSIVAPYYSVSNEMVWGATAMILSEFLEIYKRTEIPTV